MSFSHYKNTVEYGDTVIMYITYENMLNFEVTKGKMHQTKYGAIKHDDLIGLKYGKKLNLNKGFVYLLHPTPELWTFILKHRTQILYNTDISLIIFQLDLKPGSVVIEAGTGSASLSHSILRTICPKGHLHTFDFHSTRAEIAAEELKRHGFDASDFTVRHRDVCSDGFDLESAADAVFLDLPKPWLAISSAKKSLIPGGRFCSFSPCLEQVQKTSLTLAKNGFVSIETWECLICPQEVRTMYLPIPYMGTSYNEGVCDGDGEKEEEDDDNENLESRCILHHPPIGALTVDYQTDKRNFKNKQPNKNSKKMKLHDIKNSKNDASNEKGKDDDVESDNLGSIISLDQTCRKKKISQSNLNFKALLPSISRPGHTGFLTFATLYPQ